MCIKLTCRYLTAGKKEVSAHDSLLRMLSASSFTLRIWLACSRCMYTLPMPGTCCNTISLGTAAELLLSPLLAPLGFLLLAACTLVGTRWPLPLAGGGAAAPAALAEAATWRWVCSSMLVLVVWGPNQEGLVRLCMHELNTMSFETGLRRANWSPPSTNCKAL